MNNSNNKIVTRFAPSPTGNLHCGAYRTAIFSYLYARKHDGTFILRIEDTDTERSKKEYEDNILDSLNWLGLEHDIFVRQSDNVGRHREVLEQLIKDGHAYISKEEAKDGSGVIKEIVRFKNPNIDVTFEDEIKGSITMNSKDLGDFVIAKNINEPLFHLAVVVDDFDEGVTHVIRGEDHVSNTPRQILIQRATGAPTPIYAHLPLVLGFDKQKLSKRKGALAVTEYRDLGYLPEALLNMVSMIGWNPGTDQEIFSKQQLIQDFELSKVQKSPAVFNPEKLDWLNKEYLKLLSYEEQEEFVTKFIPVRIKNRQDYTNEILHSLTAIIMERISKGKDIPELFKPLDTLSSSTTPIIMEPSKEINQATSDNLSRIDSQNDVSLGDYLNSYLFPLNDPKIVNFKDLIPKGMDTSIKSSEEIKTYLQDIASILENEKVLNTIIDKSHPNNKLWAYADSKGRSIVLWPLRKALSGQDKSLDPFNIIRIIGKPYALKRIMNAVEILKKRKDIEVTSQSPGII